MPNGRLEPDIHSLGLEVLFPVLVAYWLFRVAFLPADRTACPERYRASVPASRTSVTAESEAPARVTYVRDLLHRLIDSNQFQLQREY